MREVLRIIDANLNRTNEALRTIEDYARMVLNDAGLTEQIKQLRHDLRRGAEGFDSAALLAARDTSGDVGTAISNESEQCRSSAADVAAAACKRAAEALRCIEEYGKVIAPAAAGQCEQIRYRLYTIEQETLLTSPRRQRLGQVVLHVLITESLCRRPWIETCELVIAAAGSGARIALQLREKSISDRELLDRARRLRELTAAHDVLFFVNDRPDIARLAGADGVHLGQDDLRVEYARVIVGPTMLIGKSTHTLEQARAAMQEPIDYIAVGPMFASKTKPADQIPGPALLQNVVKESSLPVVAIGGITEDKISLLRNGQPRALAVSQAIIAADDPKYATGKFLARLLTPPPA